MTVSSVSRSPRSLWSIMPQDLRRKSCDDYDAINPDFPPPSLKPELEKQKKKDKKWSIGGLFRRKKKVSDTDSSSPIEDEEEKKGFLERRRARKKKNRGSKDVTGSFEHVIIINPNRQSMDTIAPDHSRLREVSSERLVGRSHESLTKRHQEGSLVRGSSASLETAGRKGGRIQIKSRVEASRDRLKVESSSDEGEGSSRHSTSSMQRLKGEDIMGSKDGSLSRRSRAARTERYKKRLSRDDESFKDFQISPPSRISRSDERLSNKKVEKTPSSNRWTAKVVYYESSDYDTKYTAKTKSATPSPIQSPKVRPKNALHYTASAPSGSNYVTYPPRECVAGSHQELRSQHYHPGIVDGVLKPNRFTDVTPPRLPKSNSDMINKVPHTNSSQKHHPSWGQNILNRKSASYDCNVNNLHYANSKISQPHPMDENVLVVQFPISRPTQKLETKLSKMETTSSSQVPKQTNPPPPPPRDPHRRLVPTNGYHTESSPRPMSYAFEDRNQHQTRYQMFHEFGSTVSAFQRVPQVTHPDIQPPVAINKHHRSSSDHHIPLQVNSVKYSPPMARRPTSAQQDSISTSYPAKPDMFASSPPSDLTGALPHYQYYTDQQPRSRKPIHIGYQTQKLPNDPYLSDSQVVIKPTYQQNPRGRPPGVQNATEFWKQKDQESVKNVHLSEGSPKLIQRHLLNVTTANERSRSNSPRTEGNVVTSKLKLPPLIMPVRGADSTSSLSSQSSPRDIPSPRTPSSRKMIHNEIGIPVFDDSDLNCVTKREYRPLSMLEEKTETSEQEASPARDKLNHPPKPPTRRDSKVNTVTNVDNFDIFSDDNELKEDRPKSSNLEEALNELEAIYKSLRLGEEGYLEKISKEKAIYENNRLDPTNWNAWVQSRGFESDSSFNYSRSSLESVDSIDSPLKRSSNLRRSAVPDRITDDMAYRRLNKKERPPPQEQEVISQAGSFLLVSPTLSPPPFKEAFSVLPAKNEPDVTLDDVVYRNIKHTKNTLKIVDPQPLFGIPLGPVTPAPNSDYLHATPTETYRPTFKPRKIPDVVTDDLAFRNLRKDNNKEPLFSPEDTTLIDSPTLKKKRAVRSLSANLLSIIQKESMAMKNHNKLIYNNNIVQNDLEKSQSFTDVTDAINVNGTSTGVKLIEKTKLCDFNSKKNLSGEESDVTPRGSRFFPVGTASPSITTSTETLTSSKASLWSQELKPIHQQLSQNSTPRLSLTPERRCTTESTRNSVSPSKHLPIKSESLKLNYTPNLIKSKLPDFQRSPTPDSHTYTHHSDKQRKQTPPIYDQTESDLLAILAREAKEASEQLSKELYELNFDKKLTRTDPVSSEKSEIVPEIPTIHSEELSTEYNQNNENTPESCNEVHSSEISFSTSQNQHKPLPIGKITPHKPVKLNTFYITEDNKLENKQTVVTQKPVEIEGSKSMTDLLKELTKSLDFDFGNSTNQEKPIISTEEFKEEHLTTQVEERGNTDETTEKENLSETNESRTTEGKECEESYFSSLEEVHDDHLSSPERALLSSLCETPHAEQSEQRIQTLSPVNSFPLEIPEKDINEELQVLTSEVHLREDEQLVISDHLEEDDPSPIADDSGGSHFNSIKDSNLAQGGCPLDCSSVADEGKACLKSCVTHWTTCVNHSV